VNTTNEKVDLNANPCGKALLKVAGKELMNECQKIGSLKPGEMAVTGPAKLDCRLVCHVRSSHWDNGKGTPVMTIFLAIYFITCQCCSFCISRCPKYFKNFFLLQILRQIVKKCLDQVEKDKLTSIAIPAIGTGNLHFPRPDVAKIFFEEVTKYFNANPQSGINDVRLVAYGKDKDTVDAFLGLLRSFLVTNKVVRSLPANDFLQKTNSYCSHLRGKYAQHCCSSYS
jgi:poly [ADP-ribose] polymerase 10/14/15